MATSWHENLQRRVRRRVIGRTAGAGAWRELPLCLSLGSFGAAWHTSTSAWVWPLSQDGPGEVNFLWHHPLPWQGCSSGWVWLDSKPGSELACLASPTKAVTDFYSTGWASHQTRSACECIADHKQAGAQTATPPNIPMFLSWHIMVRASASSWQGPQLTAGWVCVLERLQLHTKLSSPCSSRTEP